MSDCIVSVETATFPVMTFLSNFRFLNQPGVDWFMYIQVVNNSMSA